MHETPSTVPSIYRAGTQVAPATTTPASRGLVQRPAVNARDGADPARAGLPHTPASRPRRRSKTGAATRAVPGRTPSPDGSATSSRRANPGLAARRAGVGGPRRRQAEVGGPRQAEVGGPLLSRPERPRPPRAGGTADCRTGACAQGTGAEAVSGGGERQRWGSLYRPGRRTRKCGTRSVRRSSCAARLRAEMEPGAAAAAAEGRDGLRERRGVSEAERQPQSGANGLPKHSYWLDLFFFLVLDVVLFVFVYLLP
ncbi:uncharacterized protein C4orf3 homolog [Lemur catta]|uniref:uncharacterized protein C4orf3 homolog n=1 Tax=Lemur catta TaxID=9447 RepID=UPI001E266752|nr:uncharacterized protein C4orf3 homolog [Lemur catta]